MAAKKGKSSSSSPSEGSNFSSIERLTNLVALLLVKGESQNEKIRILDAAGYSPTEIATLLTTTANTVNVTLSRNRKRKN